MCQLQKHFWYKVIVLILPLAALGCGPTIEMAKRNDISLVESPVETKIPVFKEGEFIADPYKILGKIFVQKRSATIFSKPSESYLMDLMKRPAAKMGANAIIGFRFSSFTGHDDNSIKKWASGLAVRILDQNEAEVDNQTDLIVVIPRIIVEKKDKPEKKAELDQIVRKAVQYQLERKGYYAIILNDGHKSVHLTIDSVNSLDDEALMNYGDKNAELIAFVTLAEAGSANLAIMAAGSAALRIALYSKKNRQEVWQNEDSGSDFTFGWHSLFGGHKKSAIYEAVGNVIDPLAPKSEKYYAGK